MHVARYRQEGGLVLEVHEAGGRSLGQRVQTGGVEGAVTDSIGVPLPGVLVGVVGSNQGVYSDAEGYFGITGLAEGRYQIRLVEPKLRSFGHVAEPVTRDVIRGELTKLDYRMPSVGDVLFDACRGEMVPEGSVVLVVHVRDARGRSVPGALVSVEWSRFDASTDVLAEKRTGVQVTADEGGFYRFCGVPEDKLVRVSAGLGERESVPVEVFTLWDEGAKLVLVELPPTPLPPFVP